jgi:Holliday junction resolvase
MIRSEYMAMTPEAKVKSRAKEILDKLGAYYFMPATGGYGRSGIPDIVGCLNGVFFAIECKAGKGIPTALQEREINKIRNAGGHAWLVNENNVNELFELMSELSL